MQNSLRICGTRHPRLNKIHPREQVLTPQQVVAGAQSTTSWKLHVFLCIFHECPRHRSLPKRALAQVCALMIRRGEILATTPASPTSCVRLPQPVRMRRRWGLTYLFRANERAHLRSLSRSRRPRLRLRLPPPRVLPPLRSRPLQRPPPRGQLAQEFERRHPKRRRQKRCLARWTGEDVTIRYAIWWKM